MIFLQAFAGLMGAGITEITTSSVNAGTIAFFAILSTIAFLSMVLYGTLKLIEGQFVKQSQESITTVRVEPVIFTQLDSIKDESFGNSIHKFLRESGKCSFSQDKLITTLLKVWEKFEKLPDNVRIDFQAPLRTVAQNFPDTDENIDFALQKIKALEDKADIILNKTEKSNKQLDNSSSSAKSEIERNEIADSFDRALKIADDETFIL